MRDATSTARTYFEGLAETGVPGAQIYASVRGETVIDAAFGVSSLAGDEPLDPAHALPLLCAGKPLDAIAVGRLQDLAELSMDDELVRFWPELEGSPAAGRTIASVLSHSTGLLEDPAYANPFATWDEKVAATVSALAAVTTPGNNYLIAAGWQLIGEILVQVTGSTYEDAMRALVLDRLDDDQIALRLCGAAHLERRPMFIRRNGRTAPLGATEWSRTQQELWPGLSTVAPIRSYARIFERLVDSLVGTGQPLLSAATAQRLTTPARPSAPDAFVQTTCSWGNGFELADAGQMGDRAPADAFGHTSAGGAAVYASPGQRVVVAVAANCQLEQVELQDFLDAVAHDLDLEP